MGGRAALGKKFLHTADEHRGLIKTLGTRDSEAVLNELTDARMKIPKSCSERRDGFPY